MSARPWTDVTAQVRPYLYDDAVQIPCVCGEATLSIRVGVRLPEQRQCWNCGRVYRARLVVEVQAPALPEGDEG